ncbi:MAG: hypothetical protein HYT50_01625 [Candidatus Wildermuthbacteria bacterium]|nr:hypothetical protein [Candidatus Wildermuthbacteria bacterium]
MAGIGERLFEFSPAGAVFPPQLSSFLSLEDVNSSKHRSLNGPLLAPYGRIMAK